ncbi:hypothetical protein RUM43_002265, partial [Polyplax serrata]
SPRKPPIFTNQTGKTLTPSRPWCPHKKFNSKGNAIKKESLEKAREEEEEE